MKFLTSFFTSKATEKPPDQKEVIFLMGAARFELEITGEEYHQAALEAICGPRVPSGVNRFETAWLLLEENNPRDRNAVRVEIRGKLIGYLCPDAAMRLRQQLKAKGKPCANGQCQAVIRGGWVSSDGRKGSYRVSLDLPLPQPA